MAGLAHPPGADCRGEPASPLLATTSRHRRNPVPGEGECHGVAAALQVARRWTSQTVTAMSSTDSASSQPPSIHWNGQNRLAGW